MPNTPRLIISLSDIAQVLAAQQVSEKEEVEIFSNNPFGIDDARRLKHAAYQTPQTATSKYIVINTPVMTREAQNALLKVCEEPPLTTQILAIIPSEEVFLPTLRSRFILTELRAQEKNPVLQEFLEMSVKERLIHITNAHTGKDTAWFSTLFSNLPAISTANLPKTAKYALMIADKYAQQPSANKKMLAEELALSLPVEK